MGVEEGVEKTYVIIMVEEELELLSEKRVVVLNLLKQVVFKVGLSQPGHPYYLPS